MKKPTPPPLKRGCPLTGGGPISMTQDGFDRCCAAKKLAASEAVDSRKNGRWRGPNFAISFQYPCPTCAGPPPELTIIDLKDYLQKPKKETPTMPNIKKAETPCQCCQKKVATLRKHNDKMVCSTCLPMRIMAKNNPAAVLESMREFATLPPNLDPHALPIDDDTKSMQAEIEKLKADLAEYIGLVAQYKAKSQPVSAASDTLDGEISMIKKRLASIPEIIAGMIIENNRHLANTITAAAQG